MNFLSTHKNINEKILAGNWFCLICCFQLSVNNFGILTKNTNCQISVMKFQFCKGLIWIFISANFRWLISSSMQRGYKRFFIILLILDFVNYSINSNKVWKKNCMKKKIKLLMIIIIVLSWARIFYRNKKKKKKIIWNQFCHFLVSKMKYFFLI